MSFVIGSTQSGEQFTLFHESEDSIKAEIYYHDKKLSSTISTDDKLSWDLYLKSFKDPSYSWEFKPDEKLLDLRQRIEDDTDAYIKWVSFELNESSLEVTEAVNVINYLLAECQSKDEAISERNDTVESVQKELASLQTFSNEQQQKFKNLEEELLFKFSKVLNAKKRKIKALTSEQS